MSERYKVVERSESGHDCCFEATVVDTQPPNTTFCGKPVWVCECYDMESAQKIVDAMNAAPQPAEQKPDKAVACPEGYMMVPAKEFESVLNRADWRTAKNRAELRHMLKSAQPAEQQPELAKYQPCGCVVCTCEHETQCQGCGAKHCGTHPVGQIPVPVYQQPAQDVAALEPFINKATGEKAMNKPKNRHRNLRSLMREESADFGPVPAQQPAPDVKALVEALTELCDEIDNHDISSAISETNILWFKRKARAVLAAHCKQEGEG